MPECCKSAHMGEEMNTTQKGPTGSNCVRKRASRIPLIDHQLWISILVGLMCAVALTPSVVGDNGDMKVNIQLGYPTPGSLVEAGKGVDIYASPPSKYFGNWFNEKVGTTQGSTNYDILMNREYPSLGGNQIWIKVKLTPTSDLPEALKEHPCWNDGCWAFFGWHRGDGAAGVVAPEKFALQSE